MSLLSKATGWGWQIVLLLLLAGAGFVASDGLAHSHSAQAAPAAQTPTDPPSAREGHAIYQENCAPCHGTQGWGDGPTAAQLSNPPTALADPQIARAAIPNDWFQVTKEGRMALFMPPWKNRLSDAEIWDVVAFALTLHTTQNELARGQTVWGEQCAACHGDQGAGDGPEAVAKNWTLPDFSDPAYASQRSLTDWFQTASQGQGNMPAFADVLSEQDLWNVSAFMRTFSSEPLAPLTLPSGDGVIRGAVSNGTPGGDPITGLTVTLRPFENLSALPTQEATVGEDGSFVFEGLPTGADYAYLLSTDYKDVDFTSVPVNFAAGPEQTVMLNVFEAGAAPGEIRVDLAQWFVDYQDGALLVGELYRLTHEGDRVYVGGEEVAPGKKAVLRFELPADAVQIATDGGAIGDRFILAQDGLVDTKPLPPGQSQLLVRYLLPYSGTRAELAHAVRYPVSRFSVLVSEGPKVSADGLTEAGTQAAGGINFTNYEAANVPANQTIRLQFRDLARVDAATTNVSTAVLASAPALLFGLAGLVAVTILGLLALALWRRPQPQLAATVGADPGAIDHTTMLQVIADLDDSFAAGEIDEDIYRSQRAALKRSLLATNHPPATPAVEGSEQPAHA